ncbi:MAG: DnaJ domain-containing protein [Planctomycetes bacterium]|nr:DnaJ domain-containing protein [Planctomycetota bacterium]
MERRRQKSKNPDKRKDLRYTTMGIACPLGQIVDLSASGMRIRTPGRPSLSKGRSEQFVLRSDRQKLTVTGCVAWVRRRSLISKQYEIGVRFTDSRPAIREALVAFAKYGFVSSATTSASTSTNNESGSSTPQPKVARAAIVVENYYKILGVDRTADEDTIRKAYWVLAKTYHPDSNDDPAAEIKFRKINEAHEVLMDARKRRRYDEMLLAQLNAA